MFLRNLFLLLAIIGFALTGMLYYRMYTEPPPLPPIVQPAVKPFSASVVAPGIIEAISDNISIGTPVSGIVKDVFVQVNDDVEKGDPLFEIDDRDLIGQLYVHKANLLTAQANQKRLEDKLERLMSVKDPRAISQDELTTKRADVDVAKAEVQKARAEIKQSLLKIQRLTVKAPQDGQVLQSNIHPGEFVQASADHPVMVIGDTDKLQVRADIDEQNASRIRDGQPAVAYLKNNQTDSIPLRFVRIEPYMVPKKSLTGLGVERVDTRVLQVVYQFENNLPFPVYVGEQVDVFINTDSKEKK